MRHPNFSGTLRERFDHYSAERGDGGWLWTGPSLNGYGILMVEPPWGVDRPRGLGKQYRAHRLSYEYHVGPVPDDVFVCHHCDTKLCVRPNHLFLGTALDNNRDCQAKGRAVSYWAQRTHCSRGHEYTPENTRYKRGGSRVCRTCNKMLCSQWYAARQQASP